VAVDNASTSPIKGGKGAIAEPAPSPEPLPGHPTPTKLVDKPVAVESSKGAQVVGGNDAISQPSPTTPGHPTPTKLVDKPVAVDNATAPSPSPAPGGNEQITQPSPVPAPAPAPLPLSIMTPNGGEVLTMGDEVKISWTCSTNPETFNIYLSTDGGKKYTPIAQKLSGKEMVYVWKVKGDASKNCYIKVSAAGMTTVIVEDTSDKAFEIKSAKVKPAGKPTPK